jgi:hypothetical protein
MAILFSGVAVLVRVTRGAEPFERVGVALPSLLLAYVTGGLVAGALAGLLLRYARTAFGMALVGFVVALPVVHAAAMAMHSIEEWIRADVVITSLITALVLGPAGALGIRYIDRHVRRATGRH